MFEFRGLATLVGRRVNGVDYMALGRALRDWGHQNLCGAWGFAGCGRPLRRRPGDVPFPGPGAGLCWSSLRRYPAVLPAETAFGVGMRLTGFRCPPGPRCPSFLPSWCRSVAIVVVQGRCLAPVLESSGAWCCLSSSVAFYSLAVFPPVWLGIAGSVTRKVKGVGSAGVIS